MSIRHVFNDIDGCLGEFSRTRHMDKQGLESHAETFEEIRRLRERFGEVSFSVLTGRSIHHSDNLIPLLGFDGISLCEMGNVVYWPARESYLLYTKLNLPRRTRRILDHFVAWIRSTDIDSLLRERFPCAGVRVLRDRAAIFTVEYGKPIGDELLAWLREYFLDDELLIGLDRGLIKGTITNNALDIRPFIGKGEGLRWIARTKGLDLRRSLAIGDAWHSDHGFMRLCGYVGCPSNADPELRAFVSAKLENGYVSDKPNAWGNLDILRHALSHWTKGD